MCAQLLACPLCSQPGFLTVDALRAGLVSVATRPLICPICNEVLLGIDKLTIHLFGHTINVEDNAAEPSKRMDIVVPNEHLIAIHNAHNITLQDWNALKTQQLDKIQTSNTIGPGNDMICIKSSEPGISHTITENKISIINNSQSQEQNHNLFARNANQHSFVSDYNYDLIKVNILPQSNENHNIALKSIVNAQQGILRTPDATQHFCNDNVKYLNVSQENTQTEKTIKSHLLKNSTAIKIAETMGEDTNVYQNIERECVESNNNQCVTKDKRLTINLPDKENNFRNSESVQNTLLACLDASPEERNDKEILFNTKEIMLKTNDEQEENLKHKKILPHVQTSTAFLGTVASKEKMERCNICGFHFSDVNILALHKQLIHEQDSINVPSKILKNYSCHLCSKIFKMRGSLMIHMRVAHVGRHLGSLSKDDEITFTCSDAGYNCPTCGKKFKKEQHVIQHLKTHEGKQWECDICSKMFTTKYFLKKHKRLHSGEMPYKCKICDKSFTFQQSYHKHRLYHKDDKPHNCTTCGRSFKELSTLHNHERIHTGEKPFACETCGKCFRQRVSYLVHRRIHTGVMPYKCTMCNKSFRYKVSQRTHKCPAQTSNNTQQLCNNAIEQGSDNIIIKTTNTLQDDQSCTNALNKEDKFILIINDEGQHVLTLQSEINNMPSKRKERNVDFEDSNTETKNIKNKTWSTTNLNSIEFEESVESIKKMQSNNEKLNIKSTNDFFSMVISPFENNVVSPTFEMEHLRVSSPKRKEDSIDSYIADFPQVSDNAQMSIVKSTIEQNFSHDKDVNNPLQTINEESLKELLYGMNRK